MDKFEKYKVENTSILGNKKENTSPTNIFDDVVGKAAKGLTYIGNQALNPIAQAENIYKAGEQFVGGTGQLLGGVAGAASNLLQGNTSGAQESAMNAVSGFGKITSSPLRALPVIGDTTTNLTKGLQKGVEELAGGVSNIGSGLYKFGEGVITAPGTTKSLEGMQQATRGLSQTLSSPFTAGMESLPDQAKQVIGSTLSPISQGVEQSFNALISKTGVDPQSKEAQNLKQMLLDTSAVIPALSSLKNIPKTVQMAKGVTSDFSKGVSGVTGGISDLKNILSKNVQLSKPLQGVASKAIKQLYNIDEKTQKIILQGNKFVDMADKGLFDSAKALNIVSSQLNKRLDDLSDLGRSYTPLRKLKDTIPAPKSFIDDFLKSKYGLTIKNGKIKATPDALVRLKNPEVARLQELKDFYDSATKNGLDTNKFLNVRKAISDIANFEAGVDTGTLESIAKSMRKELNKFRPENLSTLDKALSQERNVLKGVKKYILDKDGNIKDSAEGFISNLGNNLKSEQFRKLSQVIPDLQDITDAIYALKGIEKATSLYAGGSSAVKQIGASFIGGTIGGIPGAIAGAAATNPSVAVNVLKKLGKKANPLIKEAKETKIK